MAYGFRATNSGSGSVQIDRGFFNLALLDKVDVTSGDYSTAPVGTSGAAVSLLIYQATSVDMPILAWRSSVKVTPFNTYRNGNVWTFRFMVLGSQQVVTIFRFGKPPVLGAGFGLRQKFNGEVTFDSRLKYLRRIARVTPGTGSVPSGKTYAAMLSNPGYTINRVVVQDGFGQWRRTETRTQASFFFTSGGWEYSALEYYNFIGSQSSNPGNLQVNKLGGYASLIDVTGY